MSTFCFIVMVISLIILAFTKGDKTTYRDKDIGDYWSGD